MSISESFAKSVHEMRTSLMAHTGNDKPLMEIYLDRKTFDEVMIDFYKCDINRSVFMPSEIATFEGMGVKIKTK